MEERDPRKSDNDPPYSNQEKDEVIKRYWKRKNKQVQAKKPSSDSEEEVKKRIKDFFQTFNKTKHEIPRDEENIQSRTYPKHFKKSSQRFPENFQGRQESPPTVQPRSHRSTYPKHSKKSSQRFPENFQGRRESPPTVQLRHRSSKSRPCSSDSSIIESPTQNPYPEGFDLRSILHRKSHTSQENIDCNQPNKRYKSLKHERSSSVEMETAHQFSRREPRSQRRSNGGSLLVHGRSSSVEIDTGHQFSRREPRSYTRSSRSSLPSAEIENANLFSRRKPKSQRRSSNRSLCHSCRCRSYDSFSSSENESYHSTKHENGLSRYHSRRSYHRKQSRSHYPGREKSSTHRKSPRPIPRVPIDMAQEPHSSRSQPLFQTDYLDYYNPVTPSHSHFDRSYDVKRGPHSTQNYTGGHPGYKRDRSSSLEQWGWSRSPSKDNVQEKYFDEDLAIEKRRHKAKKIKVSSSAEKQKFPINEIRRSPTLDRGNSRRYSGKTDAPKKTLKGEPSKDKLKKEKCPVDKDYNKRLYEEFIKTTKKNIEKWITSNDESNSIERSPRVFSHVATNNEPVRQTESQDISSQEIEVLIEKCREKSQKLTSKENKSSVEQNPIVVTSNETDLFDECEIPKITLDEKRVSDEEYLCEESIASDATVIQREVSNKDQCDVSEGPEITFIEERKVKNEKNKREEESESEALEISSIEREFLSEEKCKKSVASEVSFIEEKKATSEEAPDITFVEGEVSNKDNVELYPNSPTIGAESEALEISFVEREFSSEEKCEKSVASQVSFIEEKVTSEEAPDITFVEGEVSNKDYVELDLNSPTIGVESEDLEISFVEREFSSKEKCERSEASFIEDKKVTSEESPEVTFVEREVSNKDCEELNPEITFVEREVSNKDCEELDSEVTFVEEKKIMKENIHRRKSETREVSFVDRKVLNESDQCKKSDVSNEEEQLRKPEAQKITSKRKESFRNTVSLSESPPATRNEYKERKPTMPNSFFCNLCQIQLTSEITFNTHMVGRKHKKKMQSVYKISTNSLRDLPIPSMTLDGTPRFDQPPLGRKRKLTRKTALLQSTIDEILHEPVAGLEYVHEILSTTTMDVGYYCSLCDAPCQAVSIMPHLIGFRHQLRVARRLFPDYDLDGDHQDQVLRRKVRSMLSKYEYKYGRGTIQVFKEDDDPDMRRPAYDQAGPSNRYEPAYNQAGPSNRYPTMRFTKNEQNEDCQEQPSRNVMPDLSKGDFFCRICDSHMNNLNMWEQHLRGRRHLQNVRKVPGESISKIRTEKLPGIVSKLEQIIDERAGDELIVGLDYIRETRGPAGEMYNCFLCGACCTNYDIIEHLMLLKHRTKYLEQLNFEGKSDDILEINGLELKETCRESLVIYQCYKMVEDFGRGKVEVYKNKS